MKFLNDVHLPLKEEEFYDEEKTFELRKGEIEPFSNKTKESKVFFKLIKQNVESNAQTESFNDEKMNEINGNTSQLDLKCGECNEYFNSEDAFINHIRSHVRIFIILLFRRMEDLILVP